MVVGQVYPYVGNDILNLPANTDPDDSDDDYVLTARNYQGYEAPTVALLRVCKTIHAEAEHLLYRRNVFVLPAYDLTARFFKFSLYNKARREMIKSVELSFNMSDLPRSRREHILDRQLQSFRMDMLYPERTYATWEEDLPEELHNTYKLQVTTKAWPHKAGLVVNHLALDSLVVHFGCARCTDECCDLRAEALQAMDTGFQRGMPKKIKLLGLKKATQAATDIMAAWTLRVREYVPLDIEDDEDGLEEIRNLLEED